MQSWPRRLAEYAGPVPRPAGEPLGSKIPHSAAGTISRDPGLRAGHPDAGGRAEAPAECAGLSPVVFTAVLQDGDALEFASEALQAGPEIHMTSGGADFDD